MPSGFVTRSIGRAAGHVPGLRRLPVFRLVAIAEVGMMARDHLNRLTPPERRRLIELVRVARGRPSNLKSRQRDELAALVAKLEPRVLAGEAVQKLSPVPLPKRMTQGSRRPR